MLIFMISSVILTFLGLDFTSALGAAASSLGNIGPAIGSVSPVDNFAHLSAGAKWFCSFLMLDWPFRIVYRSYSIYSIFLEKELKFFLF